MVIQEAKYMPIVSSLGTNLKNLLKAKGMSERQLGIKSGVSSGYINKIIHGKVTGNVTDRIALPLAKVLGVTVEELLRGKPPEGPISTKYNPDLIARDVDTSLRAYIPVFTEPAPHGEVDPVDYIAITREKTAGPFMKAYRIRGLCFEPEIRDGDTLVVDQELELKDKDLMICVIDDQITVKRFRERSGKKYLENNHGSYNDADCFNLGVILEILRKIKID